MALSRGTSSESFSRSSLSNDVLNNGKEVNYLPLTIQTVHYSKPILSSLVRNSVNDSALESSISIVDVSPETPFVSENIEYAFHSVSCCSSGSKYSKVTNKPLHSKYLPTFGVPSIQQNDPLSEYRINTMSDKLIQTDGVTLDSISDNVISLLLSASVQIAFLFILKLIRARFPNPFILKVLPDFSRVLITGTHPRCWTTDSLLASLRVKIRSGNKLYDHMRKILFSIPICFFSK